MNSNNDQKTRPLTLIWISDVYTYTLLPYEQLKRSVKFCLTIATSMVSRKLQNTWLMTMTTPLYGELKPIN